MNRECWGRTVALILIQHLYPQVMPITLAEALKSSPRFPPNPKSSQMEMQVGMGMESRAREFGRQVASSLAATACGGVYTYKSRERERERERELDTKKERVGEREREREKTTMQLIVAIRITYIHTKNYARVRICIHKYLHTNTHVCLFNSSTASEPMVTPLDAQCQLIHIHHRPDNSRA